MLVLSRQRDEHIICHIPAGTVIPPEGLTIDLCPVDIRGDKVRLGFSAPKSISIHRKEVQDVIDRGETPRQTLGGHASSLATHH